MFLQFGSRKPQNNPPLISFHPKTKNKNKWKEKKYQRKLLQLYDNSYNIIFSTRRKICV